MWYMRGTVITLTSTELFCLTGRWQHLPFCISGNSYFNISSNISGYYSLTYPTAHSFATEIKLCYFCLTSQAVLLKFL